MATTTNKGIEKPTYQQYADDPTGWTDPVNANWDLIDSAFGGTYSVPSLTSLSSDITLTTTQCQNVRIKLTGTATTPKTINVFFPANIAGAFVVDNATSGPFTINLKSAAVGALEFVEAAQNANTFIWLSSDAGSEGVYLADNSPLTAGAGITVTGTTVALEVPVTVARGGTGATSYTAGQLLIGNNAGGLTASTLTAGSNITITNGNGTITIGASGSAGGVTTFSTGTTGLTPSAATAGAVTLAGTLAVSNGGTGATSASSARSNLGLGTMATQSSSSISITGGSIGGSTSISTTGNVAAGGIRAASGAAGTNAGFYFSSGTASFAVVGTDGLLNFTTNTSMYTTGTGSEIFWSINASTRMRLSSTEFQIYVNDALKPGSTSWINPSDARIKKDVADYTLSLSDLKTLRPVSYKYNGSYQTPDNNITYVGLIAQEVQQTPFATMVGSTKVDGVSILNLDNSQLVYALINAVRELDNRVKALEAKLP